MNSRKNRALVETFSKDGVNIFYCLLGLIIAVLGFLVTFGIITSRI